MHCHTNLDSEKPKKPPANSTDCFHLNLEVQAHGFLLSQTATAPLFTPCASVPCADCWDRATCFTMQAAEISRNSTPSRQRSAELILNVIEKLRPARRLKRAAGTPTLASSILPVFLILSGVAFLVVTCAAHLSSSRYLMATSRGLAQQSLPCYTSGPPPPYSWSNRWPSQDDPPPYEDDTLPFPTGAVEEVDLGDGLHLGTGRCRPQSEGVRGVTALLSAARQAVLRRRNSRSCRLYGHVPRSIRQVYNFPEIPTSETKIALYNILCFVKNLKDGIAAERQRAFETMVGGFLVEFRVSEKISLGSILTDQIMQSIAVALENSIIETTGKLLENSSQSCCETTITVASSTETGSPSCLIVDVATSRPPPYNATPEAS